MAKNKDNQFGNVYSMADFKSKFAREADPWAGTPLDGYSLCNPLELRHARRVISTIYPDQHPHRSKANEVVIVQKTGNYADVSTTIDQNPVTGVTGEYYVVTVDKHDLTAVVPMAYDSDNPEKTETAIRSTVLAAYIGRNALDGVLRPDCQLAQDAPPASVGDCEYRPENSDDFERWRLAAGLSLSLLPIKKEEVNTVREALNEAAYDHLRYVTSITHFAQFMGTTPPKDGMELSSRFVALCNPYPPMIARTSLERNRCND